jgi:hypothetical protein
VLVLWFLGLVGLTAAAVAAYNNLRRRDPDAADVLVRTLTQVTTVLVVVAQAVITALDALRPARRPFVAVSDPREYRRDDFDD